MLRASVEQSMPRQDLRHAHVDDAQALMGEDHEHEQQAVRRRRATKKSAAMIWST